MTTTTVRKVHAVTDSFTDAVTSIPEAANATGYLVNLSARDIWVVKGGASAPDGTVPTTVLQANEQMWCETDHIWVKGAFATGDKVAFEILN